MTDLTKLSIALCLCLVGCRCGNQAQPPKAPDDIYAAERAYVATHTCTRIQRWEADDEWSITQEKVVHRQALNLYRCEGISNSIYFRDLPGDKP